MWVVDMMLRVVLSVVLWVVLSVVIPMFGFVFMIYLVMLWVGLFMLWVVGLFMLRVAPMISEVNLPDPQFVDAPIIIIIYSFDNIAPHVVLKMLRIISRMLRYQMKKKMERVRDDLKKLQERLEKAYRNLEYADEEMMIVPYGTTNTLFHNLRAVCNDLQDISDDLFMHEDKLKTMARMRTYEVHWYSPFVYVYLHLIYFPRQINSQNKTLKNIDSRLEEILKQELNNGLTLFNLNTTVEHEIDLVGGIEQDTENLVEKLMITSSSPGVHVYGIVGERGIGKTTLARKIFNHQTIKDKFHSPPPIWVDVHMNSTFHTIMNSINKFDGDLIQDKEILVVLNDVNDSKVLKDMTDYMHLITNANVLVTTRYESVITHEGIYKT
ncbi:putative disease resistance RPP13-like protein 2 [Dioscorea cayenensis subsp. rotundata]|uniref:Disease resistance RPP13-like protein 2 n=1 Tax=Dioscorea cayennensis subsp. rotundata TaxID=55577 RepID=A0AB40AKF7_DIOCR|nr:putative disease resistance RPP13-like protein 2 [Dioscorea cayenensis subsp. rotundata]